MGKAQQAYLIIIMWTEDAGDYEKLALDFDEWLLTESRLMSSSSQNPGRHFDE